MNISKKLLLACGLSLACACATPAKNGGASTGGAQTVPLIGEFKARRFTLSNGLRLIVVEDHSSPTIAYQTWFNVGSRNEVPGYTGLAHLFEHMMFKGTQSHKEGEFDHILESAGAEGLNAFTSRDYTAYVQELPKDKLDLIAQLESDRMVNLIVNDESFKTEREVVQNERRYRTENSPDGFMYQEIFGLAFKTHPYSWPVIGFQKDLDRMSAEDARKFYKTFYKPNHATIVVVGDVTPAQVKEVVEKHYGSLPKVDSPEQNFAKEPKQTGVRRQKLKLSIQVEKILMGFHIPEATHEDAIALEVLRAVLSSGKSSRLQRALVETGIASSVGSFTLDDKDPSLLLVSANLQKGKKAAQAEAVILREIQKMAKEPVSLQELERARNGMSFDFYQNLSNNFEKAEFIGRYEVLMGGFEKALDIFQKQLQVTPQQIQKVAREYLAANNRNVIVGVPK